MPYDRIILQGKGYVSTEALSILSENNRSVILLDTFGNPPLSITKKAYDLRYNAKLFLENLD